MGLQQQQWYLYIIRCKNSDLYTGVTLDVQRRFLEHQQQGPKSAKYLRGRGPLLLAFYQLIGDKSRAYQLERWVKSLSKLEKEKIIQTGILSTKNNK